MHRGMSYRKPVPVYIPSPPHSPCTPQILSAGRTPEVRPPVILLALQWHPVSLTPKNLKLPEHWHDAIAQARGIYDSDAALSTSQNLVRTPADGSSDCNDVNSGRMHSEPSTIPPREAHPLPRLASPVYFASNSRNTGVGQHQVCRNPICSWD
ncbi:hypothetical protein B0H12DRAFT_24126 [Mycena haematopus]|nr:hypothetical protein B0H12DRAFT_24126 [Mycena haematopus]